MKIGHQVILNAVQDIEDIKGKEKWKDSFFKSEQS